MFQLVPEGARAHRLAARLHVRDQPCDDGVEGAEDGDCDVVHVHGGEGGDDGPDEDLGEEEGVGEGGGEEVFPFLPVQVGHQAWVEGLG